MKGITIDDLIYGFKWFAILTIVVLVGGYTGSALRDHFDHIKVIEGQLEHTLENLGEAKEQKYLYRELAIALYRHDMHKPESGRKEATKIVDEWVTENRDSVNVEVGFLKRQKR